MIMIDIIIWMWEAKNPDKPWKDLSEEQKIECAYLLGWGDGNAFALPEEIEASDEARTHPTLS